MNKDDILKPTKKNAKEICIDGVLIDIKTDKIIDKIKEETKQKRK